MGKRKLTIENLKNLDDDGSFDKMVEKAREDAKGNHELAENLLTERVLNQFFSSFIKNPTSNKRDHRRHQGFADNYSNKDSKKKLAIEPAKDKWFKGSRLGRGLPAAESSRRFNSRKKVHPNPNQRRRRIVMVPENPQLPAELKARIEAMNGTEIKLVIHKQLYPTDLNTHHQRISMPRTQIFSKDFLRPEEEKRVHEYGEDVDVKLIGPRPYYKSFELKLKKWDSRTSWQYALTTNCWIDFIEFYVNEKKMLEDFDVVQIWSFRCNSRLHLALVKVEDNARRGGGRGGAERGEIGGGSADERRDQSGGTKNIASAMAAATTQVGDQA